MIRQLAMVFAFVFSVQSAWADDLEVINSKLEVMVQQIIGESPSWFVDTELNVLALDFGKKSAHVRFSSEIGATKWSPEPSEILFDHQLSVRRIERLGRIEHDVVHKSYVGFSTDVSAFLKTSLGLVDFICAQEAAEMAPRSKAIFLAFCTRLNSFRDTTEINEASLGIFADAFDRFRFDVASEIRAIDSELKAAPPADRANLEMAAHELRGFRDSMQGSEVIVEDDELLITIRIPFYRRFHLRDVAVKVAVEDDEINLSLNLSQYFSGSPDRMVEIAEFIKAFVEGNQEHYDQVLKYVRKGFDSLRELIAAD